MSRASTLPVVAVVIGLAGAAGAGRQSPDLPPFRCSAATLRGAYGLQWIGTRPVPGPPQTPPLIETFTGVAIRTFDGEGSFTQVSNVKGAIAGLEPENIESFGTYDVNEDCTGTASSQFVPGGPIVTARFVIVDGGGEVLQSVMTPAAVFNAGVLRKVRAR